MTDSSRFSLRFAALALLVPGVAGAGVDFRTQVWPILNRSCIECHKAPFKDKDGKIKKPKGDLRLDGAGPILKGGSNGDAVVPGNPDKSSLYERILLPASHEDAMPPKDKGKPLSFAETEVIKEWIIDGAEFGGWKGNDDGSGGASASGSPSSAKSANPLAAGAKLPPAEAIAEVEKLGALVGPVSTGSPLLRVEWVSGASQITDKEIALLGSLSANINELDLSNTKITDAALAVIGKCTRLTWLNLSNTAVSDAGLASLKGLSNLDYLNLHSTSVTDNGLAALKDLRKLRSVYLWKTRVTPDAAARFAKSIPDLQVEIK